MFLLKSSLFSFLEVFLRCAEVLWDSAAHEEACDKALQAASHNQCVSLWQDLISEKIPHLRIFLFKGTVTKEETEGSGKVTY